MAAPDRDFASRRSRRFATYAVLVLGCALVGPATRVSAEDPPPDRVATEAEVKALTEKINAMSSFRAVYDLESKNNKGELILNYRDHEEGHLSVTMTPKSGEEGAATDWWMLDGRFTSHMEMPNGSIHGSASFVEPFELARHMRSELEKRVGKTGDYSDEMRSSFCLGFSKDAEHADRMHTNLQLLYVDGASTPRVNWLLRKEDWKTAHVSGDRIVVEVDECRYELSIETGFLTQATVADVGTVKLRELGTEVNAQQFVPGKAARDSEDKSSEFEETAWRTGMHVARTYAYGSLAAQAGKLDDDHLVAWKDVVEEHYETWFETVCAPVIAAQTNGVDAFLAWYAERRAAIGSDADALSALEADTKTWREKLEAGSTQHVEGLIKSLAVPSGVKIESALGERGVELESEAVRAAGRKVLLAPLLQKLDDGVRSANETK